MRDGRDRPVDQARRDLLRRIGIGAGIAYAAPVLTGLDVARASTVSAPSRPARQPVRQRRRAAPPPPELVVIVPRARPLAPLRDAGYRILDERSNAALDATVLRVALPAGRPLAAARRELAQMFPDGVTDENHLYRPEELTCSGDDCTAHAMIGWQGWGAISGQPRIGMIDTGINVEHPALRGRRLQVHQVDLGTRSEAGRQHGTAIAATLIGTAEGRVPGLLPGAELIAVEAFHKRSSGDRADAFALVEAFDRLLGERVSVINMSFSGPENAALKRMIERAHAAEIGLVAAAGNGGPGAAPAYPAAWPEVIAVTAVDASRRAYRQANRGPYVRLAAPGVNLWTAASISGGRLRSGTSYAVPFVTAALAVERARAPSLPLAEATQAMFDCASDLGEAGFDPVFGHGLVNAPGQCQSADSKVFSISGE